MIRQVVRFCGVAAHVFFVVIGVTFCVVWTSCYVQCLMARPTYVGNIHDCRTMNVTALWEAAQIMTQKQYPPRVRVSQYPEDKATLLSLESEARTAHFIFAETEIATPRVVPGKLPTVTAFPASFAQR